MAALDHFRVAPELTIKSSDFFVDVRGFKTSQEGHPRCEVGGKVKIRETTDNDVSRLSLTRDGSDFFFPWVNRGVGEVTVPIGQPDGTIVVTGGMNGCALQVNRSESNLIFYHDADSKYLGELKKEEGDRLCRIEPSLYQKIPYGEVLMLQTGNGAVYLYQMICVRHDGKWKVMYSGILLGPGINMPILRSFTPGVSNYLASFEE